MTRTGTTRTVAAKTPTAGSNFVEVFGLDGLLSNVGAGAKEAVVRVVNFWEKDDRNNVVEV